MSSASSPRRCVSRAVALGTLILTMSLAGCGGRQSGPQRVAVDGQVTFHGRPLESGSIRFIPISGTRGPRSGAVIERGRYRLPSNDGPVVGKLRVEIRAQRELGYDVTEPTESVLHIGDPLPPAEIPPEYNDQSTLVIETTAGGDESFDFHLPTAPMTPPTSAGLTSE